MNNDDIEVNKKFDFDNIDEYADFSKTKRVISFHTNTDQMRKIIM